MKEFVIERGNSVDTSTTSGPKNEPPPAVQEKVLSLIQSWADAFRHQPELAGVSQVRSILMQKILVKFCFFLICVDWLCYIVSNFCSTVM